MGEGDAFYNFGSSVYNTFSDLPGTTNSFIYSMNNLDETWKATLEYYSTLTKTNRGMGEIAGEVMILVSTVGLGPAIKGSTAAGQFGTRGGTIASITSDANKLHHIFDNPEHNFGQFLETFGGNQFKAGRALEVATQRYVSENKITGIFEDAVVNVKGTNVTVSGTVINGRVRIGTAGIYLR